MDLNLCMYIMKYQLIINTFIFFLWNENDFLLDLLDSDIYLGFKIRLLRDKNIKTIY